MTKAKENETNTPDTDLFQQRVNELELLEKQQHQLIQALTDSKLLYKDVLDHIPLAISSLDVKGNILLINRSFGQLFDISSCNQTDMGHITKLPYFKNTALGNKVSKLLIRQMSFDTETRIPGLGDPNSFFRVRGLSMGGEDEDKVTYLIIIGNITKRRFAEKNLILAKEKAEESSMLKTAFLSNLSHEIRTPLNHILGFLELLLIKDIPESERQEYTSLVRGSSEILLKRIEDVISISKIETKQMDLYLENCSVLSILDQARTDMDKIRRQQVKNELVVNILNPVGYADVVLLSDVRKIRSILNHLIENALTFTNEGFIEVGCKLEQNNGVCFYVKDTGTGIAPEYHEIIFEHFRQVDNSSTKEVGGSGLGLAIAKGMSHLLKGDISLESIPGAGSVFYLHLPESIVSLDLAANSISKIRTHGGWADKVILVADYELIHFTQIKQMLMGATNEVYWVKTSDELIAEIYNDSPDLIFINKKLPGKPIQDVIQLIKRKYHPVPLVIIQEPASEQVLSEFPQVDAIIDIPIQRKDLIELMAGMFHD